MPEAIGPTATCPSVEDGHTGRKVVVTVTAPPSRPRKCGRGPSERSSSPPTRVTYANLFPDRFGALVLDGVVDPVAWTTGVGHEARNTPFTTRQRSDVAAQATLEEFFRLCDPSGPRCSFSGRSAARSAALAARLRATPLTCPLA